MTKNVLITGAAKRIGWYLALSLAASGFDIVIHHGHSELEAGQLGNEINNLGRKVAIVQSDFSHPESIAADLSKLPGDMEIDYLVNNAAIFEALTFHETTLEAWNHHLSVNLTAPFLVSRWFSEKLRPGKRGRIINVLDWRALRPQADHFPYTVSKAALAAMTKSMAVSLAPSISVNGVAFGAILPPSDGAPVEKMLDSVPLGRTALMDEVCQTILFLLQGPEYITGEIIHLDGGRHLL